ncbi:hypothetical protein NDK47_09695 [Brevibacillus ruminantium]|uniref:Uncharacterized protein n=1 Tax=Brevibacillus ruminantium TaxID=2950604 RepID=A0ABY4WQ37_9BACL|nr:hypothetical protein [Brevibacillus ruminantium]USG67519.1 hypothetical protein NDK47_09695 [Brevibacillus ruminantium]
MKREDALANWLQIKLVAEARPEDRSAADTASFFEEILREDHKASELSYHAEEHCYVVTALFDDERSERRFDREEAETLLRAIESEPRYNQ